MTVSQESEQPDEKSQAIQGFVEQLDEPARRDFIEFTLRQRRPRLHRLFVTASRRLYLARTSPIGSHLSPFSTDFSNLAKAIKSRGHEDGDLCRKAADFARLIRSWPEGVPLSSENVPSAEAGRAAQAAAEAASVTADDIAAYNAPTVEAQAALAASLHAIMVVSAAHAIDARASSKTGLTFAAATSLVAMEKAQNEHLKWLKRRLAQGAGSDSDKASLLVRLLGRRGSRS